MRAPIVNKEQLALIIRFVDKNNEIREEFLKYIYMDLGGTEI